VYPESYRIFCDPGYQVEGYNDLVYQQLLESQNEDDETVVSTTQSSTTTTTSQVSFLSGLAGEATTTTIPLPPGIEESQVIKSTCTAAGNFSQETSVICEPKCGDGRVVPVDHLPWNYKPEQCDDGNLKSQDGCNAICRVEKGWVCTGGGPDTKDSCRQAGLHADSSVVIAISGQRIPDEEEIADATLIAVSEALGCPARDLEFLEALFSHEQDEAIEADGESESLTTSTAPPAATSSTYYKSEYHVSHITVAVSFRVKMSDPKMLSLDEIKGAMAATQVFLPKLKVAYVSKTSLSDLYVTAMEVVEPTVDGDESLGEVVEPVNFLIYLVTAFNIALGLFGYFFIISVVAPLITWVFNVRSRPERIMGNFNYLPDFYKEGWISNICSWTRSKATFISLIFCMPARIALTWDHVGLMPYWSGVIRASVCCGLYLCGCWPCGSALVAGKRGDLRDFFGFGDGVKGNVELGDVACYICCPICSVIQEARHVDSALRAVHALIEEEKERLAEKQLPAEEDDAGNGKSKVPKQAAMGSGQV